MDFTTQKLLAQSSFRTSFRINGVVYPQPVIFFTRLSCALSVRRKASVVVNGKNKYAQQPPKKNNKQNRIEEEDSEEEYEDEFDFDEDFDDEDELDEELEEIEGDARDFLEEETLQDIEEFEDQVDFKLSEETEVTQQNIFFGDGGDGGGISVGTKPWEKEALNIAEKVSQDSFNSDLKIYAFKTSPMFHIYLRIEKVSTKYGSPSISDIQAFTIAYREKLNEAESDGRIPGNVYLEVSSPGVERVLRIPEEFERFKEKPMYVKYISDEEGSQKENDGIFTLISYDLELGNCIWAIADVRANKPGKGRPLNKKQKEWRLNTSFDSLKLVRVHSDC